MRRILVLLLSVGLITAALVAAPAAAKPTPSAGPTVYVGQLSVGQLKQLTASGVDRESIFSRGRGSDGTVSVEVVLSALQAAKLADAGVKLSEKKIAGSTVSKRLSAQSASGFNVFRSYSEPGGIRDELVQLSKLYPKLTKLEQIGQTVQGKPILALKITKNATQVPDGRRPAVLYSATQHAREWITTEMNRRLMHYFLEGYSTDATIAQMVDSRELWFIPVANPDGYDYTFTPGNRLWRKNLRDNDGDGVITALDGVDPNRNFAYHWGYDNEGSSPNFSSETYRGTRPNSEPETRALDGLLRRIGFSFQINYHSAAELLLYGAGYQVATNTPDDLISEAMVGDDANPAVPGYDPDLGAELYTTNGETDEHAHQTYGTIAFTPEMSTCETASAVDPDDAFDPAACDSVFNFPDSEALVQAEFTKNIPFALAVAQSAAHPADPVSVVGRTPADFLVHSFATSYGDPQPVAVTARRSLRHLTMHYSINGRRAHTVSTHEWRGGERYGDELNTYYAEFRGVVRGARPGDHVTVWFSGRRPGHPTSVSSSFTYQLAENTRHKVLILADEDYKGVNPTYPASVTSPKYVQSYLTALRDNGYRASVWDVTKQGVPDHLGVLSHFDAVVWYLGDNRLTQDAAQEQTEIFGDEYPDAAVTKQTEELTISVRDYLNEHGKLVHTGETAGYFGILGSAIGGIYYGLDGATDQECVVTGDLQYDCALLSNDFFQYYLGAYVRTPVPNPDSFVGIGSLAGRNSTFGGPATVDNPLNEPGVFTVTSDVLPASQFPLFASKPVGGYLGADGGVFDPVEGSWYVGTPHLDDSYLRLTRTVDLTGVSAADAPNLQTKLSYDTEEGFDNVIVEAHTVGADDWTTLPDANGRTSTTVPAECEVGYLIEEHPFLQHYLTPGDPCGNTGTTGAWNAFTGNSGGWQQTRFDLSAYAGKQVEVTISYVSDPAGGGVGLFIDDTKLVIGGATVSAEGFETGLGPWTTAAPPAGSPPSAATLRRAQALLFSGVSTRDTVLFGFGVEQLGSRAERASVLGGAVRQLLRPRT